MDWNWTGISFGLSIISGAICFIVREIQHKRTARFDIALSKVYQELSRYICIVNRVHTNINSMPLAYLKNREVTKMDEWLSIPIFDLQNRSMQIEMFFPKADRKLFRHLVDSVVSFKFEVHKALQTDTEIERLNIYDRARSNFNKQYNDSMLSFIELTHKKLFGKWH